MIKFVEHEIREKNDEGINKVSYYCDERLFRIGLSLNNGFNEEDDFNITLSSKDEETVRKLLDEFESMCVEENAESKESRDDFDLYSTRLIDVRQDPYYYNTNIMKKYRIYDSEKCNELFNKIIKYMEKEHKEEFDEYYKKLQKTLQDKDSRFNMSYINDDFSIKLEYNAFNDDFMYMYFRSNHKYVEGTIEFRVNEKIVPEVLEDCKKIATLIRNSSDKTIKEEHKPFTIGGNVCGIRTKDTNGKEHCVSNNNEVDLLIENILVNASKTTKSLRELIHEIRTFDFEESVKPIDKLMEKYPFFFDVAELNETGYKVICSLINKYASELNNEDKEVALEEAKGLVKRFTTQK